MTGPILVGFDFPIGLPAAYAKRVGIEDFATALAGFGQGRLARFLRGRAQPEQIALARPFYPARPGGRSRRQLVDGLRARDLAPSAPALRSRDREPPGRLPDVLDARRQPGRQGRDRRLARSAGARAPRRRATSRSGRSMGRSPICSARHRFVVAETYPGEVYGHLDLRSALRADGGKRRQAARAACADRLLAWAERAKSRWRRRLRTDITGRLRPQSGADDRFDAVVGLFGMLNVLRGAPPERRAGRPGRAPDRGLDPGSGRRGGGRPGAIRRHHACS